jgi:flagellar biosynthetic protein FliR
MQVMGHVIDQQVGFAAATVFDPASEQMHSLIGELLVLMVLVTFLSLDIHHKLLLGIASTIHAIPLGQSVHLNIEVLWQVLSIQFALAFALACPVILSLWLVDVILALASRSLPQANIYFVAMPVKIAIGLLLVVWLTGYVLPHLAHMFELIFNHWLMLF